MSSLSTFALFFLQQQVHASGTQLDLLTIFVGIIALFFFLLMVGMAIGAIYAMKMVKEVKAKVESLEKRGEALIAQATATAMPFVDKAHVIIDDLTPKIQSVTSDVEAMSRTVRAKVEEIGVTVSQVNSTVQDTNSKTRMQIEKFRSCSGKGCDLTPTGSFHQDGKVLSSWRTSSTRIMPKADTRWTLAVLAMLVAFFGAGPISSQDSVAAQATALMQAGKFHDAETLWRKLVVSFPKNAQVRANLGVSLSQQGEMAEAANQYRALLALDPHQPEVAYNLGVVEFKQGRFSDAIPAFKNVSKMDPDDKRTVLLLGMSYYGLRNYAAASPYLQAASRNDPSNLELRNAVAQSCLWSKKYDCAMEAFQSIVSTNICYWPKRWTGWTEQKMRSRSCRPRRLFLRTNPCSTSSLVISITRRVSTTKRFRNFVRK